MQSRFSKFSKRVSELFETRDFNLKNPASWQWVFDSNKSVSGANVTPESAAGLPAVYAAINTYANEMATLPIKVYDTSGETKQLVTDNNMHRLLSVEPNSFQTPFDYHHLMESWKWAWGYALAVIERSESGEAVQLMPVHPSKLKEIKFFNDELYYSIEGASGMINGRDMIHLKLMDLSADSFKGKSPITMCREAIGTGMSVEKFAAGYFGNGVNPGLVVKATDPAVLQNKEHLDSLHQQLNQKNKGPDKSHNHILLPFGLDLAQGPTISNQDAQFIETQSFEVIQVARIFNLPPNILRHQANLTYNNAEQELIHYVNNSIRPVVKRNEQEYTRKLARYNERGIVKAKYSLEARLRGDTAAQTEHATKMLQLGVYDIDEVRDFFGKNPLPEGKGKIRYVNGNSMELGKSMNDGEGV